VRKTILFVTHDLDEALKLGNQTSVLEGGRIVQTGKPEDIVLRPASAYVGEFVQHMNPLSVLNGRMVMRPWSDLATDGDRRWLDPARQYSAILDAQGRPAAAMREGEAFALRTAGEEGLGLLVADIETPLRQLIQWCKAGHPVLLEESGVVRGVCGPTEVLRALATSDARARAFS
jgi:glycine betaine/proline transport system ATP-binding protein